MSLQRPRAPLRIGCYLRPRSLQSNRLSVCLSVMTRSFAKTNSCYTCHVNIFTFLLTYLGSVSALETMGNKLQKAQICTYQNVEVENLLAIPSEKERTRGRRDWEGMGRALEEKGNGELGL